MKRQTLLLLFLLPFTFLLTKAQQPLNFGFEQKSFEGINRPWGWSPCSFGTEAYAIMDSINPRTGKYALQIRNTEETSYCMSYWVAPRMIRGSTINLTAWVKDVSKGDKVWLSAVTWGDPGLLDSVATAKAKVKREWQQLSTSIKIDSAAYTLVIEIHFSGKGEIKFDDIRFELNHKHLDGVPVASEIKDKEVVQLKKHSYPFQEVKIGVEDLTDNFDDLEAFGALVKDAKIIGLGESTHGTSEFFSMKHRLLAYAVHKLGTRVFAFEDNQLGVEKINEYVLEGKGELKPLFKYLFGVWNTEEVYNMIQWVRNYNIKHPNDKVEFVGFDAQNPSLPIKSIAKNLSELDPELKSVVDSLHQDYYAAWQKSYYPRSDYNTMKKWYDDAKKVELLIAEHSNKWTRDDSNNIIKSKISWLKQNARSVSNAALAYTGDVAIRDQYLAENISWIIEQKQPKGPVVVWAHDVHINHGHGPDDLYNYFEGKSMGTYLRDKYGTDYKAFGFFTYDGTYATYHQGKPIEVAAFPAPSGSIDEALHRIGKEEKAQNYILDLSWASNSPYDHFWMIEPRPVRFATYFPFDYGYETMVSLPFQFDGVIFIDRTKAAVKLK